MKKTTRTPRSRQVGRRAILILGMHRSGTSALGGAVNLLGAAAPKTLMPANAYNLQGYWESAPLVAAHDEMLASAESSWHDWRRFDPQWLNSEAAQAYRRRLKQIIIEEF